ncbi:hypothetical protein [Bhargavaea cecembensis]|jgi:hypothetical protein|uniref:hypothetical protein n=1 Tax=Bhargavaea cecembensis TaxID=394098 RepID=UPI0012E7F638|nr:hypothetical protein [Bhargavaea cecembensis]
MPEQIVKWGLVALLIGTTASLIVILQSSYIAEAISARALPLAIVAGLSSIAVAIAFRK